MTTDLLNSCQGFNEMYGLPVSPVPTIHALGVPCAKRLESLAETLRDEVDELDLVKDDVLRLEPVAGSEDELDVLTAIADNLGDLCVFAHSEAKKFGIPLDKVLRIIMDSNGSKKNPDGTTSYDERGKVMKGPNYWKPEPKIKELIREEIAKFRDLPKA